MANSGLLHNIYVASIAIDSGRKGFATRGEEQEGRLSYEKGIARAMTAFLEAKDTADPGTIVRAEQIFLSQELQFCDKTDRDAQGSLTLAIQGFMDALACLGVVEDAALYKKAADKVIPSVPKYRIDGLPKDAFHIACRAHKTRIRNVLRAPGIDTIEKNLLKQRRANLSAAEKSYMEKQERAMSG